MIPVPQDSVAGNSKRFRGFFHARAAENRIWAICATLPSMAAGAVWAPHVEIEMHRPGILSGPGRRHQRFAAMADQRNQTQHTSTGFPYRRIRNQPAPMH
jgi:hypothetical protein